MQKLIHIHKESGAIEQDADVILLLYDPLYENNKIKKNNNMPEDVRHIEVIVAKQRNGNTGIADLIFDKQFCRFKIPSNDWQREISAMRIENN